MGARTRINIDTLVICRDSSIPLHADFHAVCGIRVCRGIRCLRRKTRNCPFFATFISNSRFFGLLLIFAIYNTIKSSRCKLTFMIIMNENDMTCVNAVNDIGIIYDNIFITVIINGLM